jgi:tripartite-type tricarboxylate transporter receptor subunit TctC
LVSRLIAQGITSSLGQPVIVDNRSSGVIPGQIVSQAQPGGYVLLVNGTAHWLSQLLRSDVPYDAQRDFVPISMLDRSPYIVVVHPSVPAKSIGELIALAKAKPGTLNYSTGASGSSSHLAGELFKYLAGVDIVRVPYKSNAVEIPDLLGGQVQMTFSTGGVAPHVRSGKLRALAVTSAQPSPLYPGVPTASASGLPGYQAISFDGLFAPAKTPEVIIKQLNHAVVQVLHAAEVKERLLSNGVEAVGSSPEELADAIRSGLTVWGKLIKAVGIKAD